jgi:hypothetical protein
MMTLQHKKCFLSSPDPQTTVWANVFYTRSSGLEQCCIYYYERRDDIYDAIYRQYSMDNGRTWSSPEELQHHWQTERGTFRTWRNGGGFVLVHPERDRLLRIYLYGTLPNDHALDGMIHWAAEYALSTDGGRTNLTYAPIVQQGAEYTPTHPVAGVWMDRNALMPSKPPILSQHGKILQPVDITPLGPDGKYYNPGGGSTYSYSAVLVGDWPVDNQLQWALSQPVTPDPQHTTRGFCEPTLAQVPDGRILMVLRGSNDVRPELPGVKWYCIAQDGGYTWTAAQPWRYTNGERFYSPSSISRLFRHSNGKTYWLGNISPSNARGNSPRYPLVIGEVDEDSLLLRQETVLTIDDRQPEDHADVQLSNFSVYEDRVTGEIVMHCTRFLAQGQAVWNGDTYEYRLTL